MVVVGARRPGRLERLGTVRAPDQAKALELARKQFASDTIAATEILVRPAENDPL